MTWTNADASAFRDYAKTSGAKLLKYLQDSMPKCDGKTIEEVALQATLMTKIKTHQTENLPKCNHEC